MFKQWCIQMDNGIISPECVAYVMQLKQKLISQNILPPDNFSVIDNPASVALVPTANTSQVMMTQATTQPNVASSSGLQSQLITMPSSDCISLAMAMSDVGQQNYPAAETLSVSDLDILNLLAFSQAIGGSAGVDSGAEGDLSRLDDLEALFDY